MMNLPRLIIIALAVWLVVTLYRRFFKQPAPPKTSQTGATKNMVRCTHCGLHLPETEAIAAEGRFFCSPEHRRLHEDVS